MRPKMKGMSLPLETIVLLILAAVVLAALLAFFLGVFTPANSKVDIIKKQSSYCQQIFAADSRCRLDKVQSLADSLQREVCGKPSDSPVCGTSGSTPQDCIKECCRIFCP